MNEALKAVMEKRYKAQVAAKKIAEIIDDCNKALMSMVEEKAEYYFPEPVDGIFGVAATKSKGRAPSKKIDGVLLMQNGVSAAVIQKCTKVGQPGKPYIVFSELKRGPKTGKRTTHPWANRTADKEAEDPLSGIEVEE